MNKLDVHLYDGKIDNSVYEYIEKVGTIKNKKELTNLFIQEINQDLLNPEKNKNKYDINIVKKGLEVFRDDAYDHSNKIDIQTAFCIAWTLCKQKNEEDLFFLQMVDMIITNGTCLQGRSSRCLQVILALMDL